MEDLDLQALQALSRGATPRSVATPSRGQRGSQAAQGRTANSTGNPRGRSDGPARPLSGLSGWEDDSPQPGADLLEYLGKMDGLESGSSSPRHVAARSRLSTPVTGDLTQALLIVRAAAEAMNNGGLGGGDPALVSRSSLKSQSSGSSLSGRGEAKSRRATQQTRGSSSTANDMPPQHLNSNQGSPTLTPRLGAAAESDEAEDLQLATGQEPPPQEAFPELSMQASFFVSPSGVDDGGGDSDDNGDGEGNGSGDAGRGGDGSGNVGRGGNGSDDAGRGGDGSGDADRGGGGDGEGGGSSGEADKLRGLLYSDDDDDGDEEFQDLMAADDDALFGGADRRSGGRGSSTAKRGGSDHSSRRPSPQGGSPCSTQSGTLHSTSCDGGPGCDFRPAGSSVDTTASGDAGPDSLAATAAGSGISPASARDLAASMLPLKGQEAVCVSKGDDAGVEALEVVLSARLGGQGGQGSTTVSPRGAVADAAVPELQGAAGQGQVACVGPSSVPSSLTLHSVGGHHHNQQHHHHHRHNHHHNHYHNQHQQCVQLPTAQLGEGLRQHPPQARRLYVPGLGNRSPIRGSGYVVSPAAIRPTSPSSSPGRGGVQSATQHQQHKKSSGVRRLSSPSVTLAAILNNLWTKSPRDSLAAAAFAAVPASYGDGDDATGGGALVPGGTLTSGSALSSSGVLTSASSGGPAAGSALNGGYVRMGSWISGPTANATSAANANATVASTTPSNAAATAANAAATPASNAANVNINGGGGGSGSGSGSVLRFPPTHVQNLPNGQVYRSTPINQVVGASSDEVARLDGGGGSGGVVAGPGVGAGGGTWTAPAAAVTRTTGGGAANGWAAARTGRQPMQQSRAAGQSAVGHAGPGAVSAPSYFAHERFGGSFSAPPRPSTSPHKPRSSGGPRSALGSGPASVPTPTAAAGATAMAAAGFGNGSLPAPAGEAAAADISSPTAAAAAPSGAAAAPAAHAQTANSLPAYAQAHGMRYSAYKSSLQHGGGGPQAVASGGGAGVGGPFSAPFVTSRHKSVAAVDDRPRATTLFKIFAGLGVAPGAVAAAPDLVAALQGPVQSTSPRGSGFDGSGAGGWSATNLVGTDVSYAGTAAPETSPYANPHFQHQQHHHHQQQQQQQQQHPPPQPYQVQMQLLRKASLPHLPPQFGNVFLDPQAPQVGPHPHPHPQGYAHPHAQPQLPPHPAQFSGRALYGRSGVGGRYSTTYEQSLPLVQLSAAASAATRSVSFDASRRATSRA